MSKLNYQTLTAVISVDTLKLVFRPELDFVTKHRWLFLENQPDILFALDGAVNAVAGDNRVVRGGLMISQLLAIREMKANIETQQEV